MSSEAFFDRPAVFSAGTYRAIELAATDAPLLQEFFERNPEYFLNVGGQPATPTEGLEEISGAPPQGWPYTRMRVLGIAAGNSLPLVAMANVVSDLLAASVWHIGTFIVATQLHATGTAPLLYGSPEAWMMRGGARWARLGVVAGNTRAERFWERHGYVEVRRRHGIDLGARSNTVRVMVKPLGGGALADYLELVACDRPDTQSSPQVSKPRSRPARASLPRRPAAL